MWLDGFGMTDLNLGGFPGVFRENAGDFVVFRWTERGEMRGKRGGEALVF
jgi:hypothetical protein